MSLSVNTNLYSTYNKYNPSFCSNNICKNYSTQNHPKKFSTKKVGIIALGTIALTIVGDIIFAKGKHVKSLLNLSKKSSKTNQLDSNIGTKAATKENHPTSNIKPEVTPTVKKEPPVSQKVPKTNSENSTSIIDDAEYDKLLLEINSKKMRQVGPMGHVIGDYYQPLLFLREEGVQVPQKLKALKLYIGNGSQDTRSHCRELYNDINYFLRNNNGNYIPQLEKGINVNKTKGLINFDSETGEKVVKCIDRSLKEVDKEFGVYKGFVYRNGKMTGNSGTYVSTSTDMQCSMGNVSEFHVIKTSKGHNIHEFQKKYYPVNQSENEILLPRNAKYKEVTGLQYEVERQKLARAKYEYLKLGDDNITFEDVLSKTHVWEELPV
ncbi:MAG: hypothetical protein E7Z87_08410 [Cyanobacteria bacterium SIG26]|nr:hypothetical protein [Cyanobacteria bacterium SIG26]